MKNKVHRKLTLWKRRTRWSGLLVLVVVIVWQSFLQRKLPFLHRHLDNKPPVSLYIDPNNDQNKGLVLIPEESANRTCFEGIPGVKEFRSVSRKAPLYQPVVDETSQDACADALEINKVAMMFLAKGNIHHHGLWRQWFASAAGRVEKVKACDSAGDLSLKGTEKFVNDYYEDVCEKVKHPVIDFEDPIQYQVLFSLYVHVPPGNEKYLDSFFSKYLIPRQVHVEWGEHSMMHATRELLWFAFKDPRNTRFILLSESDVPLYGPLQVYYQLQGEGKSRVDTQGYQSTDTYRWHFRFLCGSPPIRETDWRKSSQWFSLVRKHAGFILNDTGVYRSFEKYCTSFYDDVSNFWRVCYSDEHYLPTLLHFMDPEARETYPQRGITDVDWSKGGPHPMEYSASSISPKLFFGKLRVNYQCIRGLESQKRWSQAIDDMFVNLLDLKNGTKDETQMCEASPKPITDKYWSCPLAARKFKTDTREAILDLFKGCNNGLGIIDNRFVCPAFEEFRAKESEQEFKSMFFG